MRMTYHLTFTFKDTETEAQKFCEMYNSELTAYEKRADKRATYTIWHDKNGTAKWICWHYYKA